MNFFLIGTTNIVAHPLITKLLSKDENVTALPSPQDDSMRNHARLKALNTELLDVTTLTQDMTGHEVVVNLMCHGRGVVTQSDHSLLPACQCALTAARQAGVKRFIHISSIAVYGSPPKDQVYTESSPKYASLEAYPSFMQAAELAILGADCGETEVVILQPGLIYGPGSESWTNEVLSSLSEGLFPLLDRGKGLCNLIHVDDVIDAILKSAFIPGIHYESFIITNDQPATWGEVLRSYEKIVKTNSLVRVPSGMMRRVNRWNDYSLLREYRLFNRILKGLLTLLQFPRFKNRLHYLENEKIDFFTARPHFSNAKAKQMLGFSPRVEFERGIQSFREWFDKSRRVSLKS